jgi:hypothetical protein
LSLSSVLLCRLRGSGGRPLRPALLGARRSISLVVGEMHAEVHT